MKQKKMQIIRVGMLLLLLILLGNTSYAMSLGGFEVQMGTGEAAFPAEEWTEEPISPFVPEPGFQEEAGGQLDFPVEPPAPDAYGATSEPVPYPETMPYPESLPYPEPLPYPNLLPYPENEIEQPTKNDGQEAYTNDPMTGAMPASVPPKAPTPSSIPTPTPVPTTAITPSVPPTPTLAEKKDSRKKPSALEQKKERKKEELEVQYKSVRFLKGQAVELSLPSAGSIHILSCRVNGQEKTYQWKGNMLVIPHDQKKEAELELLLLCEPHRRF